MLHHIRHITFILVVACLVTVAAGCKGPKVTNWSVVPPLPPATALKQQQSESLPLLVLPGPKRFLISWDPVEGINWYHVWGSKELRWWYWLGQTTNTTWPVEGTNSAEYFKVWPVR